MTLPTGTIQMSDVNAELSRTWNATIDMNDPAVRALSGATDNWSTNHMALLRGKSRYVPVTATGKNASTSYTNTNTAGTASARPSVTPSGGTGSYTYQWTITSNTGAASLSADTSQTCNVTKAYVKNGSGEFHVVLSCVVRDTNGNSVTVTGIQAESYWGTAI